MSRLILPSLLLVFAASSAALQEEFLVYNTLKDGELEMRLRFQGITAKETSVGRTEGLKFRQLTDGNHLIQLIYDEYNKLKDCEFLHKKRPIELFLNNFEEDVRAITTSNITLNIINNQTIPSEIRRWLSFPKLKRLCKKRHLEIEESLKNGTKNRSKRDISDVFRVPGTKWCGKGYSAGKYTHLGGFSKTDRCCRRHDTACPFWISGFETKYGLFNWRVNTIMHCSCDERFRACLKMVDTSDANLVGKLFFNVVQTKCFILKPKKICTKRSWWGKCQRRKYMKRAVLRNNLPY